MLNLVMKIVLALLSVALLLSFYRLIRGPKLQDRIVAVDLIAVLTVGVIVAAAAGTGQHFLLDAASVIVLVGFLGTVAYSWYVEKESKQ